MTHGRIWTTAAAFVITLAVLIGCSTTQVRPAQEAVAHYTVGLNALQAGKLDLALSEFNKAIECDPSNKDAHFAAGIVYYEQNEMELAKKEFKRTLSLDPGDYDAHNNLGLVYASEKNFEEAIRELRLAAEHPQNKNPESALLNLGQTFDLMGEHEKAAHEFMEALLLQPLGDHVMTRLADQYYKLGKIEDATRYYEKAVKLNPDNIMAHYGLGQAYYKSGRNVEAIACFIKVTERVPGTAMAESAEKYIYLLK
ncbi:MAG: tetratricopeptide repeat protein [Nitrospirae bacterium]|nr:tetratricopeptide repeat protein [Nitrospirota bacterium]MBI5695815.1 tetratricopeptide repeat protein [Nitrospirota bacterium]